VRGLEQPGRLGPSPSRDVHGAVLGAAEGEHVAAPVAFGELGNPVAPLCRPVVVADQCTRADEEAARPCLGDRDLRPPLERDRRCLVEQPHPRCYLRGGDEDRAVEREAEHLEVGDVETPSHLRGGPGMAARRVTVATAVGDVSLVERQPAVIGAGRLSLEEAARPP
jgi:hypothetical protein